LQQQETDLLEKEAKLRQEIETLEEEIKNIEQ